MRRAREWKDDIVFAIPPPKIFMQNRERLQSVIMHPDEIKCHSFILRWVLIFLVFLSLLASRNDRI